MSNPDKEQIRKMFCNFNWCEFYNVVLGGILTGIVASLLFIWLTSLLERIKFWLKYKYLNSYNENFDWIAYSMKKENGRMREENPNGSAANIKVGNRKISIALKHDERKWTGDLQLIKPDYGALLLKYDDAYEFDRREGFIGSYVENGKAFDYVFIVSVSNRLYRMINQGGQSVPEYNYGNEILIRERIK